MSDPRSKTASSRPGFGLFQGLLPLRRAGVPAEILAGLTLAALAIPEVMGYTKIAGTPVITGLYTMLVPMLLFAVFGSSRHLVVSADSATAAILAAGLRRIRPCLMTTATTIFALYPILASTGRGSDVAQPMALPAVGGMIAGLISLFIVPLVYCWIQELTLVRSGTGPATDDAPRSRDEGRQP